MGDPGCWQGKARGQSLEPVPAHASVLLTSPPEAVEPDTPNFLRQADPAGLKDNLPHRKWNQIASPWLISHRWPPAWARSPVKIGQRDLGLEQGTGPPLLPTGLKSRRFADRMAEAPFPRCALVG